MMRRRTKSPAAAAARAFNPTSYFPAAAAVVAHETQPPEVRPSGMLVQKRHPGSAAAAAPTIRVRIKYGIACHEIYLSSQSTFGVLKKLLWEKTGLHPQDQKVLYKNKVRNSNAYLDISGVKDGSKVAVVDDPDGRARRLLELRHQSRIDEASRSISQISLEVDKLTSQVSELEGIINEGRKVGDKDARNLIELLMTQLVKLDGVVVYGDLKHKKKTQERRVQKYVEKLDVLKAKNQTVETTDEQMPARQPQQKKKKPPPPVVTAKWEIFDSLLSPTTPATTTRVTPTSNTTIMFDWEPF